MLLDDVLAARLQMAISLGFHIIFAAVGIGLPVLVVVAEWLWLRTRNAVYLTLAKRWSKGMAILFAVGAVSGTVLSFELGLLFPKFMEHAGPVIGMPFSLEGFAFFTEAIFLGIYLYGWDKISPKAHIFSGILVAISGMLSGVFVVIANAWMNSPTGFEVVDGQFINIDPIKAMLNPMAFTHCLHMTLAAYAATGFLVAGIHAYMLLRNKNNIFHRKALGIALAVGGTTSLLMPISGDLSAKAVAKHQPIKLAAMEAQFTTVKSAPLRIGGIVDEEKEEIRYSIEIPYLLSFLAYGDPNAEVKGLNEFSKENRPPVGIVRYSFQIMVLLGIAMMLTSIWAGILFWKNWKLPDNRWFLRTLVILAPAGIIAIEAGWIVTEVGRQPWIIYGVMKTAEAVTPMPHLVVPFLLFCILYVFLLMVVLWLIYKEVSNSPNTEERELKGGEVVNVT
ncbi:MAG: cytochrome ubiquinol oxidase subunit I [Pyrinomonadaceae bacterium]|nr:cytochrome ubiquinol oxidase subunit I [Pyrinomonadaceae bacterium]MCX7639602.1 cytochrome ubiquinol oxidase subunit I [Pyrinomonadaceae bacterium]MDW8303995.1 cytochrome ubiquinol oxidase subunit I [Acidobacteriota bacterium]